jgi:ABC-type glutathione transport system ATPase component
LAADAAGPLLQVSSLSVAYGAAAEKAVEDISFSLPRGGAIGLVGESGAGKSTIALAVLGLLPSSAAYGGSIRFDGQEILNRPGIVRGIRWRRASIMLQDSISAFNPVTTIGEQIAEVWVTHEAARWKEAMGRVGSLLERVGLDPSLACSYPHETSGGQRQRAAVAMAVALSPELLIVDEPTSALDVVAGNSLVELLGCLRRETGCALLLVSHDVSVIARLCDYVAVMCAGRVVEEGAVARVLASPEEPYTRRLLDAVPRIPAMSGGTST